MKGVTISISLLVCSLLQSDVHVHRVLRLAERQSTIQYVRTDKYRFIQETLNKTKLKSFRLIFYSSVAVAFYLLM